VQVGKPAYGHGFAVLMQHPRGCQTKRNEWIWFLNLDASSHVRVCSQAVKLLVGGSRLGRERKKHSEEKGVMAVIKCEKKKNTAQIRIQMRGWGHFLPNP